MLSFCVCPFKCKWAAAHSTRGGATTACVLKISLKKTFKFKPESDKDGETQEVTTVDSISEWLLDEFM